MGQFIDNNTYANYRKAIVDSNSTCQKVLGFNNNIVCSIFIFTSSNRISITITENLPIGTYQFKIMNVTLPPNN